MPAKVTPPSPARDRLATMTSRALRERGLSYARAAQVLRVSREMLRRVACGQADAPLSVVAQIVVGLDLDVSEVFHGRFGTPRGVRRARAA